MKKLKVLIVAVTLVLGWTGLVRAGLVGLRISDGLGASATVIDGDALDVYGTSGDPDGVVGWNGAIGVWTINSITGMASDPSDPLSAGILDLMSLDKASGVGTLIVEFSESGLSPTFPGWALEWGGVLPSNMTAQVSAYVSESNQLFDSSIPIFEDFDAFGYTAGSTPDLNTTPYSLTIRLELTATNSGRTSYSGNALLTPLPEPTTMAMWSLIGGIGAVAGWRRSRRKR